MKRDMNVFVQYRSNSSFLKAILSLLKTNSAASNLDDSDGV